MDINELYEIFIRHPQVTTDSRNCPEGAVFFALKGASFDGNRYAASALDKGCAYAVVDNPDVVADGRYILVADVLDAMQRLAALHRERSGIPVVQVTGTNGKTTTKELLAAVLSARYNVLCTEGNLNNHIGVPLTLLRIRPEHDMAVVETGANHPGEIADLCRMVKADAGLVTNVGRGHLEGFGSFDGVRRTKGELYDDLRARGGTVFINAFDEELLRMAADRDFRPGENAIPYVEGRVEDCDPFLAVMWRASDGEPWHHVASHLVGAYNIANIRAAVTVGLHYGVAPGQIDRAIAQYMPTNNRSEYRDTGRNRLIIDAYNANPSSMAAAVANFAFIKAARKTVILGDMLELGPESLMEHRKVLSQLASQADIENIWLVGGEFAAALEKFPMPAARSFRNVDEVIDALAESPLEGQTILVKGSHGTRLYLLPAKL